MYAMIPMRIIVAYIRWHFGQAVREVFEWYKNMSWFGYHFFSIPLLFKTLIRPIYRIHESARPGTGLNIELFFENLAVNVIARVVGFFLRVFLIICGGIYQLIFLLLVPIFLFVWLVMPLIPLACAITGLYMVFS